MQRQKKTELPGSAAQVKKKVTPNHKNYQNFTSIIPKNQCNAVAYLIFTKLNSPNL